MRLRAPKARLSVRWKASSATYELVRAMMYRIHGAFIASLGVAALILAPNETFGGSGAAHGVASASTHSISHPSAARSLLRRRGNNVWAFFWPGAGDFGGSSYGGEPNVDVTPPTSRDIHTTYTYDVPWDAVHRFPPVVTPPQPVFRTYVPGCPAQTVTVPWDDGKEQTVSIVRC